VADASYPDDLKYHPEHDWARIDGDVVAPLSGEIVEVNEALGDSPEQINEDPYGEGWLVRVRLSDTSEIDDLLDREAYEGSLS
jgi:glycine cleavage system H protein